MVTKKREGTIGYIKGIAMAVKTTRCFKYDKINKKNVRCVQLWILNDKDYARRTEFMDYGLAMRNHNDPAYTTYIYLDIITFRKEFLMNKAATILYAKT